MHNKKIWIMIGALFAALLGAAPASAGVAIDNAVVLDPYDPVPPIQFRHWYAGYDCDYGCGYHCWRSCYRHDYYGCRDGCYHRCYDGCYARYGRRCYNDCGRVTYPRISIPCTTGDCYESTRYEHRFRDGDKVNDEWMDKGRNVGSEYETFRHHFSKNEYDDD